MNWRRTTIWVLVGVTVLLAVYDVIAFIVAGNDATISQLVLDASRKVPAIPFALGFLFGHLLAPQTQTAVRVLCRVLTRPFRAA